MRFSILERAEMQSWPKHADGKLIMEENEVYLGGFYSPLQLRLGISRVGAGIYATNMRLFVFSRKR